MLMESGRRRARLRRAWRRRRGPDDQSGFVLAFVAISLVVLLALAGFAVDYWHWSQEQTRLQKAADAAALAGAVFMPDNTGQIGYSTAQEISTKNGYTNGKNNVTVTPAAGQLPTQLEVTETEKVKNYFGALVGAGSTTITKRAVAEYEPSVSMGSPSNQFGNDPYSGAALGTTRYPELWANVFGPSSNKDKGDAYQANVCAAGTQTDNCSGTNSDYDPNGYFYGVDVQPGATGPLTFQIYDPEFANVGDNCGDDSTANGAPGTNLIGASELAPNFNPKFSVSDPSTIYSSSANSVYCNGDQFYNDGGNASTPPWTDYTIRAPSDTPANPENNPVVCSVDFPGYLGDLKTALQATTPQAGAPDLFVKYFRQWYTVCTVPNPIPGTYFIQVKTNTKANGTAAPDGGGANRFSMRVGLNGNFQTTQANVYGWGRQGIYANYPGANTTFYLARVLPGAPGRTLLVNFFDVGDASQPGTLTVQPPPDSNVGSSFSGCTYTAPPGNSTGPPWGSFSNTKSGCAISGVQTPLFNGQWVTYQVPIPANYTCDYTDATGCWTRVNFQFPNLTSVQDTTTWTAQIAGDPVRLVQ
jgi:Flp pilus assembly protein TadG